MVEFFLKNLYGTVIRVRNMALFSSMCKKNTKVNGMLTVAS